MESLPTARYRDQKNALAYPLVILVLVAAVFWRVVFFSFANYDDLYLFESNNILDVLSLGNIRWIFTFFSAVSYYPMRLLSYAVDLAVWGHAPWGFHLTNLLIHMASALLVYTLALRVALRTGFSYVAAMETAFFGGLLFAVHPVVVDSVAWIAGREELLMLFFLLLAFHLEISANRTGRLRVLLFVLVAYLVAFSCLSNILGVIAPPLITLYYLVIERAGVKKILARTWLIWIIAFAAFFIKMVSIGGYDSKNDSLLFPYVPEALQNAGFLLEKTFEFRFGLISTAQRIRLILYLFGVNFLHLLAPINFPVMYANHIPPVFGHPLVIIGATVMSMFSALLYWGRKRKFFLFFALWYLAALLPSAQIVPHHIFRADRFLYAPLVGFAMGLVFLLLRHGEGESRKFPRVLLVALVTLFAVKSVLHLGVWSDGYALHSHVLKANPLSYIGHQNLAREYSRHDRFAESAAEYKEAIRLAPHANAIWLEALEVIAKAHGRDEAVAFARKGVEEAPALPERHNNLALMLSKQGKLEEAARELEEAVALDPKTAIFHLNLGVVYDALGRHREGLAEMEEAVRLSPKNSEALYTLGRAYEERGRMADARIKYEEAIRWAPGYLPPRRRLNRMDEGKGGPGTLLPGPFRSPDAGES